MGAKAVWSFSPPSLGLTNFRNPPTCEFQQSMCQVGMCGGRGAGLGIGWAKADRLTSSNSSKSGYNNWLKIWRGRTIGGENCIFIFSKWFSTFTCCTFQHLGFVFKSVICNDQEEIVDSIFKTLKTVLHKKSQFLNNFMLFSLLFWWHGS